MVFHRSRKSFALRSAPRALALAAALIAGTTAGALSESISDALAAAYANNPSLNAVRAAQRALDENVAIARSGYRPNVNGSLDYSIRSVDGSSGGPTATASLTVDQTLFDGYQRVNAVRGAKAGVFAGQEGLKASVQQTLLGAAQAYVAVVRDRRIIDLREQNVSFLAEQLRADEARFEVGEATSTDVASARAELAEARAALQNAQAALSSSEALYVQIVGRAPRGLAAPRAPARLLPSNVEKAISIALQHNPEIRRTQFLAEQASFGVKQQEGAFLPKVTGSAGVTRTRGAVGRTAGGGTIRGTTDALTAGVRLTVPIYQGGRTSAQLRQTKESLSEARINIDVARTNVREAVVRAFSDYSAALAARDSVRVQIEAARLALNGLLEEQKVGQRSAIDVLIGRRRLVDAQIASAQNDAILVAAGYGVLSALGRLDVGPLNLHVKKFDPDEHYVAVADKWYGLRTPDQR